MTMHTKGIQKDIQKIIVKSLCNKNSLCESKSVKTAMMKNKFLFTLIVYYTFFFIKQYY